MKKGKFTQSNVKKKKEREKVSKHFFSFYGENLELHLDLQPQNSIQ